jgi:sphingomyelin phosphodiesterase acid-like 3
VRDFATGGYYSVPLTDVAHTRILVLDDVFLSTSYATCGGQPDPAPAKAILGWLQGQLAAARSAHERVWVLGHIPPGVNLYATARRLPMVCMGAKPSMFLGSEALADILSSYADVVRLALFGHTHSDEIHLLTPEPATAVTPLGVPLKIVASITPVNGNRPTFTLAKIDPASATLVDYTVIMASNLTGVDTTWAPEYTYSAAYRQPAFDAAAVASLISGFQADPAARTAASQAYLRNYFPGDLSPILSFAWPQYACSMSHDSGAAFAACACKATGSTK